MTSNFTLLGMMMGMDWVIFAELACPCLSWPATTSPVEGERGRLRVLAAPWRSSNRSPGGRIVQTCFYLWLNTLGEAAVSNDPMSPLLWVIVFFQGAGGVATGLRLWFDGQEKDKIGARKPMLGIEQGRAACGQL